MEGVRWLRKRTVGWCTTLYGPNVESVAYRWTPRREGEKAARARRDGRGSGQVDVGDFLGNSGSVAFFYDD